MADGKGFTDWFAIVVDEEQFWPGRLTFHPEAGISLETTNFCDFEAKGFFEAKHSNDSFFQADVIKGYLDYQRPTTLLKPFISKVHSGSIGYLTPLIRNRYTVTINGILKNIHLDNLDDEIFLSIGGRSDALRGWIVPKRIKNVYEPATKRRTLEYDEYNKFEIELLDGCSISIVNMVSGPSDWDSMTLVGQTSFTLTFSNPIALDPALDLYNRFSNFLTFLIGDRLLRGVILLATTKTTEWNDKENSIHAELLVRSNKKFSESLDLPALRFLTQHDTSMELKEVLSKWQQIDKDTNYFMALIVSVEMGDNDTNVTNKYIDLIGCLEKFDKNKFGGRKTLLQRLERLVQLYKDDNFRGDPDLEKIKEYRNYHPHGEGASVTLDIFKKMYWYSNFLCALGRYHILKEIGFSANEISQAFRRQANVYGMFSMLED